MENKYRKSGIVTLNNIPWGTHICQFYRTKGDLIDILVPYFRAGLENNEFCMWVTSEPLGVKEAKASLGKAVRDLDDYILNGQIEILDYSEWYTKSGKFNADEVLQGWVEKERKALEKGFSGLRHTGNTSWLGAEDWVAFREYEVTVDSIIGEHWMIAICAYSLDRCGAPEVLDVINNHEISLLKRKRGWRTIESNERKRLRKVLSASEVRFRRLFETAQDGILIIDADTGQITEVNPFLKDMLGYTTEELVGKRLWEIGLFKDIAKSEDAFKELQREGYIRYEDLQLETKDGKPVDVEFVSNVYNTDCNKVIQCNIRDISERKEMEEVSEQYKEQLEKLVEQRTAELTESNRKLLQDITERKRAEKALKESEETYRALVELGGRAGEAIVMREDTKQGEGIMTFVSDEWCHITGYSKEELLGMSFFDLVHPKYREDSRGRYRKRMRGESLPGLFELCIIRKDGTEVPIELTSAYTTYKGKRSVVAFIRDITERKKMQEKLIVTDRLASVGELAAGIAHEINNPLTSVIGFSDLLLQKDMPDDVREDLQMVNREAKRTADIIKNLLTFARKHEAEKAPTNLNKVIENVLVLRAYEQKVHNIVLKADLAPDLPEIKADGFKLQQVFLNIIINAEYFMTQAHGKGTLMINTKRVGDTVQASFADDGPGIPEENLSRLFDPFFTTKEANAGTGLGMSIAYGIITEQGGQIHAESVLGEGATFIVELPITQ